MLGHPHGGKGVNVQVSDLVWLFHLNGLPAFVQGQFAFLRRLFARPGAVEIAMRRD
jgi:hypothetical protein